MDYPLENTIDDAQKIRIRRMKAGSLFRLVATGVFTVIVPLCVFFGILALFGFDTVHVNRRQVHGVEGLIDALIMALIIPLVLSVIGWLILYVGVFIWGHFKPITISYVSADEPKA